MLLEWGSYCGIIVFSKDLEVILGGGVYKLSRSCGFLGEEIEI